MDINLFLITDEEVRYRYIERLGMLCEESEPTKEQKEMALREAKQYKEQYV
jgi:hypothetical protein